MKLTLIFLTAFMGSCALNKVYLKPSVLTGTESWNYADTSNHDTISLHFDGIQPIFHYQSGRDSLLPFSIRSIMVNDQINAWEINSKAPNGKLIYFLHGNAGNVVYQYGLMLPFVKRGYDVYMIDYSGFGFSTGKATRKNVYKDAVIGLDHVLKNELNGRELIVYGQSLGGHLAISLSRTYANQISLLVSEGAFASHQRIASDQAGFLAHIFVKEIYSAEDSIRNNHIPTLLIHSTEDQTIPYYHGEILFQEASEPKRLLSIDGRHILGPILHTDTIIYTMEKLHKRP